MIHNAILMAEIIKSKQTGIITPALANMMMELVRKLGNRGNFRMYSYRDEMECSGLLALVNGYMKFDETRYNNPHAYLTSIAWNGFMRYLNNEKKQQGIRDEVLMANGINPSHAAQMAHEAANWNNDNVQPPSPGLVTKAPQRGRPRKEAAQVLKEPEVRLPDPVGKTKKTAKADPTKLKRPLNTTAYRLYRESEEEKLRHAVRLVKDDDDDGIVVVDDADDAG